MKKLLENKIIGQIWYAIKYFIDRNVSVWASSLAFSTMLAIVPISAVVFAIARGFGYTKYIEVWFRDILSSQPQAADLIINFVNSYLQHAQSGVILGIGLIFMLYTIVMLARSVEQAFNNIWHAEDRANLVRTFTDYASFFFLLPVGIILISGLSLFVSSVMSYMSSYEVMGPIAQVALQSVPFLLMWIIFTALYVLMPNAPVKVSSCLVPAVVATIGIQLLQLFYIHAQMWVSNYNAIYGSFAALPLFMLWVQFSWTICLFGAQLSYTNQHIDDITKKKESPFVSTSTEEI